MKYKYAVVVKGELKKFDSTDKAVLENRIATFFRDQGITYDRNTVSVSIDRQSRVVKKTKEITIADAANGAKAMIKNLAGSTVSNGEILRRSAICAACPLIASISNCTSCGMSGKIAKWNNKIRAARGLQIPIPSDVSHSFCDVCSCSLSLMVLTKRVDFVDKEEGRPDNCWLNKNSKNYTNE